MAGLTQTPPQTGGSWTLAFKNLFLPTFCLQCNRRLLTEENGYFCPACWEASERIARPFCNRCGKPYAQRLGFDAPEEFPCADCREAKETPYGRIYAAAAYDDAVAEAVKRFKFSERRRLAAPLAALMAEFADREIDTKRYTDLVPVPLHPVRLRDRGFNQAQLLAEAIGPTFPNAVLNTNLRRIRPTRVQSRIQDQAERRRNVRGAFAVDPDRNFDGRVVLLIDDVVTTGGTVAECARALKRAGAESVDVFAAATPVESSHDN